jgi:nicotinate-nucleotide adenylyltransferase
LRASLPPDAALFFLMGADSLIDLPNWRSPEEILKLARIVVFPRPGYDATDAPFSRRGEIIHVAGPRLAISSEEIRARIQSGRPYRYWVPDAVWRLIEERALYRDPPG